MNSKRKKRLAKEFLVFLSCSVLLGVCWGAMEINNSIRIGKVEQLNNQEYTISREILDLNKDHDKKLKEQKWLWNEMKKTFNMERYNSHEEIWNEFEKYLKEDSLLYQWEKGWDREITDGFKEIGFESGLKFKSFIAGNSLSTQDSVNLLEAAEKHQELQALYEEENNLQAGIVYPKNYNLFFLVCGGIIFGIAYPARLLFLATKWSIKTLKENG